MKIPWLKSLEEGESLFLSNNEKELIEDLYSATEREIQYAASNLKEDETNISHKISIVEENLKLIIQRLKLSKEVKQRFIQEYPKWEEARCKNVETLECIGKSLHDVRKKCNISRLVGNCSSLIGGGICIASAALTPVTLGFTTPLAIAGGAITLLGSATSVGATVTEMGKLRSKVQEANRILDQDKESFEVLKLWLTHAADLSEALDRILAIDDDNQIEGIIRILRDFIEIIFSSKNKSERGEMVKTLAKSTIQKIPRELIHSTLTSNLVSLLLIIALLYNRNHKDFENASKTLKVMASIVSFADFSVDVLQTASAFIKSDIAIATNVSKTVTKTAVALFGMTLDMASIVLTSIDVHKGSISGQGQNIVDAADKLKRESKILGKVYIELERL